MTLEEIKRTIEQALPQATVYVLDPHNDGQHFQSIVVSPQFEGLPLVKQHQLVMNALKGALTTTVHALQLKTYTPTRWDEVKDQYGLT
jgi:acid stress-induced BolA-like protein IbaG/YrbA